MTETKERPRPTDKDIMAEVAKIILDDFMKWGDSPDDDREEVLSDLTEVLQDAIDLDGYKLAKRCEDDLYCEADSQLVDIMEQVAGEASSIAGEKVKQWVKECNIQPLYKIGDRIKWKDRWNSETSGKIVAARLDSAEYVVHIDGKEYKGSTPEWPLGRIVKFENVSESVEPKESTHAPQDESHQTQAEAQGETETQDR